jgi:hypothetical protein
MTKKAKMNKKTNKKNEKLFLREQFVSLFFSLSHYRLPEPKHLQTHAPTPHRLRLRLHHHHLSLSHLLVFLNCFLLSIPLYYFYFFSSALSSVSFTNAISSFFAFST